MAIFEDHKTYAVSRFKGLVDPLLMKTSSSKVVVLGSIVYFDFLQREMTEVDKFF